MSFTIALGDSEYKGVRSGMRPRAYEKQSSKELRERATMLLDYLAVCMSHLMVFAEARQRREDEGALAAGVAEAADAFVARELGLAASLDADVKHVLRALRKVLEAETGRYDPALISDLLKRYAGLGSALEEIRAMGLAPPDPAPGAPGAFPPTPTASHLAVYDPASAAAFPDTHDKLGAQPPAEPAGGSGRSRVGNFFRYFYPRRGESGGASTDGEEMVPLMAGASSSSGAGAEPEAEAEAGDVPGRLRLRDGSGQVLELVEVPYSERMAAEDAAERAQSLREIEASMADLAEMFHDVSAMLAEQGEDLETAEAAVQETAVQVEEGTRQLSIAARLATFGLPLIGGAVGGLLMGPVGMAAGAKGASALAVAGAGAVGGYFSTKGVIKAGERSYT